MQILKSTPGVDSLQQPKRDRRVAGLTSNAHSGLSRWFAVILWRWVFQPHEKPVFDFLRSEMHEKQEPPAESDYKDRSR